MSRARLVTGDSTVAGPGENRSLQCGVFVLNSGKQSEESPGIPSGLLFKTPISGLVLPKTSTDSIFLFVLFVQMWLNPGAEVVV